MSERDNSMYLVKTNGPRLVTLPDGTVLSRADLPETGARWVARRKAIVARAVIFGLMNRQEIIERYDLSEEELESWIRHYNEHGVRALRVSAVQEYRQPRVE